MSFLERKSLNNYIVIVGMIANVALGIVCYGLNQRLEEEKLIHFNQAEALLMGEAAKCLEDGGGHVEMCKAFIDNKCAALKPRPQPRRDCYCKEAQ